MQRRTLLAGIGGTLLVAGAGRAARPDFRGPALRDAIAACERDHGGRLGVAVRDTGSGARFGWREDERFPMCSTFKFLLAAAVLRRVDRGGEKLERRLPILPRGLLDHSPLVQQRQNGTASIAELCEAAVMLSDNSAANLLIETLGGPAAVTRFARATGDPVTRLDRNEPSLGECLPGDPRDTTTPSAMLHDLDRLLLGDTLSPVARGRLVGWLLANRTGDARLRAGLPRDWRVGDKTGSGLHGTVNDIAICWPPGRAPLLITSYLTQSDRPPAVRDQVHAAVARAIVQAMVPAAG